MAKMGLKKGDFIGIKSTFKFDEIPHTCPDALKTFFHKGKNLEVYYYDSEKLVVKLDVALVDGVEHRDYLIDISDIADCFQKISRTK